MKHIINAMVAGLLAVILYMVFFNSTPTSVTTPEIKKVSDCIVRPVKDGNCYIQTDSAGNKIRVCG
jgi:hypothetical protein